MEAGPANTPAASIRAWRTKTAQLLTITKPNLNERKTIMPTVKLTKPLNSATASSLSEMGNKIINYIRAGYPGLYLVSHEEQRVDGEMKEIAALLKYGLHLWSVVDGMVDAQTQKANSALDP